jgi:hypothetical protein
MTGAAHEQLIAAQPREEVLSSVLARAAFAQPLRVFQRYRAMADLAERRRKIDGSNCS